MSRTTTFQPLFVLLLVLVGIRSAAAAGGYVQVNLVSNAPVVAPALNTDPYLINPWGIAARTTSPFWVSDQVSGKSTLYNGSGVPSSLVVTVPSPGPPPSGPTGIVFNSSTGFIVDSKPASFIFATLDGTIDAWNGSAGTMAVIANIVPGAAFTGLTTGTIASSTFLYAADFKSRLNYLTIYVTNTGW